MLTMDALLELARTMEGSRVSQVYARASLCYAKWGDTSDYTELLDLVMF